MEKALGHLPVLRVLVEEKESLKPPMLGTVPGVWGSYN